MRGDVGLDARLVVGARQIGLVEQDHVGAEDLILEHLLERVVVLDGRVGGALRRECFRIVGEQSLGDGGTVDDRDHAVDRDPRADRRPVEGRDQWLRQGEARGLDQDVLAAGSGRSSSFVSAGTKSSATVQQMQPFGSSTMSSSVQPLMPQPSMNEPSKPSRRIR